MNFAIGIARPVFGVINDGVRERNNVPDVARVLGVVVGIEHLRDDFERALNMIADPWGLQFDSRVAPPKIMEVGQAPEVHSFGKIGSTVVVVSLGPSFLQGQRPQIHIKPRLEQVIVPSSNQRVVNKAGVLIPKTRAQFPVIGVMVCRCWRRAWRQIMPYGEQRLVKPQKSVKSRSMF